MKIYEHFNYHSYSAYHAFLKNYPKRITNYDIQPYTRMYQGIEKALDGETSIFIYANSSINAGCLLAPLAIRLGCPIIPTYELGNLSMSDELDNIISGEKLVISELGNENAKFGWAVEKVVNHRFDRGLTTFFGSSVELRSISGKYGNNVGSKIAMMCKVALHLYDSRGTVLASNADTAFKYKLEDTTDA